MTKSLFKDFRREIKRSKSRFISIMLIVALGVAFYSGIRSTTPAMYMTADSVYDEENLMDIRVVSTLGLTEADLEEISKIEGIKDIEGSYTTDFLCIVDGKEIVTRAISMPRRVNDVKLTDGAFPEAYNECIVSREFLDESGLKIGDTLTLSTGTSEAVSDTLTTDSYKIVGVCSSSYFLNGDVGTSNIGDGMGDAYIVLPTPAYVTDVYTSIYITIEGAKELNCFGKDYERLIGKVIDEIEEISGLQCDIRYTEVRSSANEKLDKVRSEVTLAEITTENAIKNAASRLEAQEQLIEQSRQEIMSNKELIENAELYIPQAEQAIAEAEQRIATAKNALAASEKVLEEAKTAKRELEKELERMQQDPNADPEEIYRLQQALSIAEMAIPAAERELANQELQVEQGERDLLQAKVTLGQLQQAVANKGQLENAEQEIISADNLLKEAQAEYEAYKATALSELEKAQEQLADLQNYVSNIEVPVWHVLDRNGIETYASYVNESDSIDAIGTVFPLIFFFVAALVSLTTMTRMVEEERVQIGTLKALGYSKASIVMKYILYAAFASILGSILGSIMGQFTIPPIIISAYRAVYYNLGENVVKFNVLYALLASEVAVLCTVTATFVACFKALKSEPASLMRPEAPKAGKRTFIEGFTFIWQRLNFGQKSAFRNLFRYKKRFFMTIFGVAGCMALLLVGLGIRDSVTSMTTNQYDDIFKYDGIISVDASISRAERRTLINEIADTQTVTGLLQANRTMVSASATQETDVKDQKNAYLIVPTNTEEFPNFVSLRERKSKDAINLLNDGVIITEKYAQLLDVEVNDMIYLKLDDSRVTPKEVKVLGITENYIFNYIYMTPNLYQALYGVEADVNIMMIQTLNKITAEDMKVAFTGLNGVNSVITNDDELEGINKVIKNLYFIIILMVVSAAVLAFCVLYNLNNINISERRRELATFRLLGFYNKELAAYVYRENTILTALGIIVGVFLGIILHRFVMVTVETDMYMFGRELSLLSVVIAIILTILFTVIVNRIMYSKLKKIDMIESLKSVE